MGELIRRSRNGLRVALLESLLEQRGVSEAFCTEHAAVEMPIRSSTLSCRSQPAQDKLGTPLSLFSWGNRIQNVEDKQAGQQGITRGEICDQLHAELMLAGG